MGTINIDNAHVMFFPDYTAAGQQYRASFTKVKHKLRDMGLQCALLFLARLWVAALGKTHFFDTPQEAWDWSEHFESDPASAQALGWE